MWVLTLLVGACTLGVGTPATAQKHDEAIFHPDGAIPTPAVALNGIVVQALRFNGEVGLLSETEQAAIEEEAVGQWFDLLRLQALAAATTQVVQAKGHVLARAYLPPQDVTEGTVEIALINGTIEVWEFERSRAAHQNPRERGTATSELRVPQHIEAVALAAAAPGQSVTRRQLERALLLMGDSGMSAGARLEAGSEPNTTRIVVALHERPTLSGNATVDNYGSLNTGRLQTTLAVKATDALHLGGTIGLINVISRGMNMARVDAAVPLGGRGWRVAGQRTWMRYRVIEGDGVAAELAGRNQSWHVELHYPFVRSRQTNVNGTLVYGQRTSSDSALGSVIRERRASSLGLTMSGDTIAGAGRGGQTAWRIAYTTGQVDGSNGVDMDGSAGRFDKVTVDLRHMRRLPGAWGFVVGVSGQWAGQNLDSAEKFSLGGPAGIRAYPSGEGRGDLGWRAAVELRYDMTMQGLSGLMQWAAFVDHGSIQLHRTPPDFIATKTGENTYALTGAGLSLTWRPSPRAHMQIGWAHAIGDNPGATIFGTHADGTTDTARLWVQVGVQF